MSTGEERNPFGQFINFGKPLNKRHTTLLEAFTLCSPPIMFLELAEERRLLKPSHPHHLHQLVYYSLYANWEASARGPPPYWFPSRTHSKHTNLGRIMEVHGPQVLGSLYKDPITSFTLFQKFSVRHPEVYWSIVVKELAVVFHEPPRATLDTSDEAKSGGTWFPGAVLNIAECCMLPCHALRRTDESVAIMWRDEGFDDSPVNNLTLKELRDQVMLVANALDATFTKGDAIAIDMPMTSTAVIIYLAIILAGYVVVSIADSFAAKEIATRMRISNAKGIFTQDYIVRGGRKFPLYSRVIEGCQCKAIVVPALGNNVGVTLRSHDISWEVFISHTAALPRLRLHQMQQTNLYCGGLLALALVDHVAAIYLVV